MSITSPWPVWMKKYKEEFFLSDEMQVKTFFEEKIRGGEYPNEAERKKFENAKDKDWDEYFDIKWTKMFSYCRGWSEEKKKFLEEVQAKAMAKVKKEIEERLLGNKKLLMQMKDNLIRGALVKKTNFISDLEGKKISTKELASVMRMIKVELGEETDISKFSGEVTLAGGLISLRKNKQKEEE